MNKAPQLDKVGKYELVGEIATGGMAVVYQAYDPFMDRFVALKLAKLHANSSDRVDLERLFYNETNAASRLRHPNIINIYDAGIADGMHYIAMEYIPGGVTLKRYCHADNLLPLELAGKILIKACEAFDFAHRKGIIHRDIKPSNILLKNDREVKISDFGLAMLIDPDMVDTQSIALMGSPRYMAPERVNEEALTHHSDIYSLGVVMYELLTGHTPFSARTLAALVQEILNKEAPPLSDYRNLPDSISAVVMKAMAKDLADRYQTMMDFAEDLSACFKDLHMPVDGEMVELRTEQIKHLSFFSEFSDTDLWELLRWSDWLEVDADEMIIQEGDVDNDVYVIIQGSVCVVKGGNEVALLKHGELFGEIAFLAERERTATVVSKTSCTLLRLHIHQIEQSSKSCQIQFQRMFISTLIDRLVRTTELLAKQ